MKFLRLGTDGWRARVGDGFDAANVARMAHALGKVWSSQLCDSTIMVGYDTRKDSERMAVVAGEAISAHHMRVMVADAPCATPALAWSAAHEPTCVGAVMLTGGNAPCEYGGIVVRQGDAGPVDRRFAEAVGQQIGSSVPSETGPVERVDVTSAYVDALVAQTDVGLIGTRHLRIVLDPLYGAGCRWVEELLRSVGCEVTVIHGKPAGDFRGLHPDAREPWVDECERAVVDGKADMGIVLDGDCTRFALVDECGSMVSPHDLAPLVLEHLVRQRGRSGRVVATLASSVRLARQAERLGCEFAMVPTGFDSIYRELREGDVILGADEHGGICDPRHLPERDSLQAILMLLELLAGSDMTLSELVDACEAKIGSMEYGTRGVKLEPAAGLALRNYLPGINPPLVAGEQPVAIGHSGGLRAELPDGSWVSLRPSHTASGAFVCAEAPTARKRDALLDWATTLAKAPLA